MKMNFCRVMELMAKRFRQREAVVNTERDRRYTFAEYHGLTNRIANMMRDELGLGDGDRFLNILENDNLTLLHFPTFFKQEATAVFTNYRESIDEHRKQVDIVEPKVVFLERTLLDAYTPMLRERGIKVVVMDPPEARTDGVFHFWDLVERASGENNDVELDVHHHVCLMRFTGGTTGPGKCAMYSVDNLLGTRDSNYIEPELAFAMDMRFLHLAPLSHGTLMPFLGCLFVGGATITMNEVDLVRWMALVQAEHITHSFMVPAILYRLLDLQRQDPHDLSSLRTIIYGAAPMSASKIRALIETMGNVFVQVYGSTEALLYVAALPKSDHLNADGTPGSHLASAGRVAPGVEVLVADEQGQAVPAGTVGEIRVRCRATVSGYFRNPEGTAAEFVDGFWCSGDLGQVDEEGFLTILDRAKDMIITGGFNVYAIEVEGALNSHPEVIMSAAVGIPHAEWGEAVHAEVMVVDGAQLTAEQLIAHVKDQLGHFKAPKSVKFVAELPLSSAGKVLRRKVREQYWSAEERRVH